MTDVPGALRGHCAKELTAERRVRRTTAASAAIASALALAGAAAAQVGLRIEKMEQVGDWAKATAAGGALYVTATPNTRAARAYCLSSHLKIPYDEIPSFGASIEAGTEAEKIGASRGYACLRLGCVRSGAKAEIGISLVANTPPEPGETGMPLGVSLRLRFAADAAPVPLFERADAGQRSRDGALELVNWSVSARREGADGPHAQVEVSFTAPLAFVERLAANPRVAFELRPGQDRQMDALKHGARTMEFGLAGTADVLADLRRTCAAQPRN
jgi:hypothetical protein